MSSIRPLVWIIGIFALLIGVVMGYGVWRSSSSVSYIADCTTHHGTYKVVNYMLQGKSYQLLVADSPDTWEYGLMNIKSTQDICGHDGMLFRLPRREVQRFWNMNTLVDLDLYWIDSTTRSSQKVTLPNITDHGQVTVTSAQPVDQVIEVIAPLSPTMTKEPDEPRDPQIQKKCVKGGCSGQLCVEDGGNDMSTCEWRETYVCYRSAICERNTNTQKCGWRMTDELTQCLTAQP